jgi:hypothetical protein
VAVFPWRLWRLGGAGGGGDGRRGGGVVGIVGIIWIVVMVNSILWRISAGEVDKEEKDTGLRTGENKRERERRAERASPSDASSPHARERGWKWVKEHQVVSHDRRIRGGARKGRNGGNIGIIKFKIKRVKKNRKSYKQT